MADGATSPGGPFFQTDDDTVRRIVSHDWASTALGPIEGWPQSLKSVVGLMAHSPVPMATLWGKDGYLIYNHAYGALIGPRHPDRLGRKVREVWPEAADLNDHAIRVGLAGGTLTFRDQELTLYRDLEPEQVWMNLDFSPVLDDTGSPAGVIVIVVETTERVLAERRLMAERDRMRHMFQQAPSFIAILDGPEHVYALTNGAYTRLIGARDLIGRRVADAVPEAAQQGFLQLLDNAFRTGKPFVGEGFKLSLPDAGGRIEDHFIDFVYQPVCDRVGVVTGIFVAGSDVTERVLAEHAFRESEERFRRLNDALIFANGTLEEQVARRTAELRQKEARLRAIFESSFSFQGLLALDGTMLDTNATSLAAIDASIDAVRGKPFWETPWFAGTPGAGDVVRAAVPRVASGEIVRQDAELDLPVGGRRRFNFSMRPVRHPDGAVMGIALEALETTDHLGDGFTG